MHAPTYAYTRQATLLKRTYTHKHTHIHTYTQTHARTHRTGKQAKPFTYTHTYTHIYIRTRIHTKGKQATNNKKGTLAGKQQQQQQAPAPPSLQKRQLARGPRVTPLQSSSSGMCLKHIPALNSIYAYVEFDLCLR